MTMHVFWVQKWEESEAGWGTRPAGYTLHRSKADIEAFLRVMRAREAAQGFGPGRGQAPGRTAMILTSDINLPRLHKIGFNLKCCGLCAHGRFYDQGLPDRRKAIPVWGFCAKHAEPDTSLRIHRLGHCRKGFEPHETSVTEAGLSSFMEFLK